jgi:hypothetical protein
MNSKPNKPPLYDRGHQAWGRIFWGFVVLVLLSVIVTLLKPYLG